MNAFRVEYIIQSANNYECCGSDTYISRKLITHFHQVPSYTLKQLLDILYVSKAVFTKYYKTMGYSSYTDLKDEFAFIKVARMRQIIERQRMFDAEQVGAVLSAFTVTKINIKQLHDVVSLIHQSNRILFYGSPTLLTKIHDFQVDMTMLGKTVLTSSIRKDHIILPNDNDLIILCSAKGRILYEDNDAFIKNVLGGQNNKILFSQNELKDVRVDMNIYFSTEDDYHEMHYLFMYYIDVILKLYYEQHSRGKK